MALEARRPTRADGDAWLEAETRAYAAEIAASGGMSLDQAQTRAHKETDTRVPHGIDTEGQVIVQLFDDDHPVGWLWLSLTSPRGEDDQAWVYQVTIDEPFRGRGYGRRAMEIAEELARQHGLTALGLNVFGRNAVARNLYDSLGYEVVTTVMRKPI